eukprot:m.85672 g.85672  ORF g.85672 m.85672 type:complete len:728 (-) comp12785_c0_seq2:2277-4460(-)
MSGTSTSHEGLPLDTSMQSFEDGMRSDHEDRLQQSRRYLHSLYASHNASFASGQASFSSPQSVQVQQLRKELSKAIETLELERAGWRQKEADHMKTVREMLSEQEAMRRADAERSRSMASFEKDLGEAVDAMSEERRRWEEERLASDRELEHTAAQLKEAQMKANSAVAKLTATEDQVQSLQRQLEVATAERDRLQGTFQRERSEWQATASEVQAEMERLQTVHHEELRALREQQQSYVQSDSQQKSKIVELESEIQRLQLDLSVSQREMESTKADMTLAERRLEAERRKAEASMQGRIEKEVMHRLEQEQARAAELEERLRKGHQQELENQQQRHHDALSDLKRRHQRALESLEEDVRRISRERDKLKSTASKLWRHLQSASKAVRSECEQRDQLRSELATQLQEVLKVQFDSASRILSRMNAVTSTSRSLQQLDPSLASSFAEGFDSTASAIPFFDESISAPHHSVSAQHSVSAYRDSTEAKDGWMSALDLSDSQPRPADTAQPHGYGADNSFTQSQGMASHSDSTLTGSSFQYPGSTESLLAALTSGVGGLDLGQPSYPSYPSQPPTQPAQQQHGSASAYATSQSSSTRSTQQQYQKQKQQQQRSSEDQGKHLRYAREQFGTDGDRARDESGASTSSVSSYREPTRNYEKPWQVPSRSTASTSSTTGMASQASVHHQSTASSKSTTAQKQSMASASSTTAQKESEGSLSSSRQRTEKPQPPHWK